MATKTAQKGKRNVKEKEVKKDLSKSYNEFKEFEGKKYTGAKVGRGHKWYYDKGEWKEKKVSPDKWEFTYAVTKRRAGKAPVGSGVPVGTEYHWYVMAHQNVRKLDANNYSTSMVGLKFKVAHKRADKENWNVTEKTQRKRLVKLLKEVIEELEKEPSLGQEKEKRKVKKSIKKDKKKSPAKQVRELVEA